MRVMAGGQGGALWRAEDSLNSRSQHDTGHSTTFWINGNTGHSQQFHTKYFRVSNFLKIANVHPRIVHTLLLNLPKSRLHLLEMFFTFPSAVPSTENSPTLPASPSLANSSSFWKIHPRATTSYRIQSGTSFSIAWGEPFPSSVLPKYLLYSAIL